MKIQEIVIKESLVSIKIYDEDCIYIFTCDELKNLIELNKIYPAPKEIKLLGERTFGFETKNKKTQKGGKQ